MCHLLDDALPSYCKSYLWLDKKITLRFLCGVRLEVHGLYEFFHHRDWECRRPLEKARIFEISIRIPCRVFFLSCSCSSRTPAGSTTLAVLLTRLKVTHTHPLTFTHYRQWERERKSVCYWESEWGKGGSEDGVAVKVIFPCVLWVNSSLCSVWAQPGPHLLSRFYSSLPFADNLRHAVLWLPLGRTVCHVRGFYLT